MSAQGIQTLLEAEKEASVVVQKSRQYRLQRIKEARSQAQKEIEDLKASKNAEFAAFEKQIAASAQSTNMDADADAKIAEITQLYQTNKALVIDKLLACVVAVKPEPHINSKLK